MSHSICSRLTVEALTVLEARNCIICDEAVTQPVRSCDPPVYSFERSCLRDVTKLFEIGHFPYQIVEFTN